MLLYAGSASEWACAPRTCCVSARVSARSGHTLDELGEIDQSRIQFSKQDAGTLFARLLRTAWLVAVTKRLLVQASRKEFPSMSNDKPLVYTCRQYRLLVA